MAQEATGNGPNTTLIPLINGFMASRVVHVAAELGIADHLAGGPRKIDELARSADAHPGALHRLMRALASAGVFEEVAPREFALTPMAQYLRSDVAGSARSLFRWNAVDGKAWGEIVYSVKTGRTAFEKVYGERFFDFLAKNPKEAKLFDEGMSGFVSMSSAAVVAAYDFSSFRRIVDVGGGYGTLLGMVLAAHPRSSGLIFEMPHVAEGARRNLERLGLSSRCEVVAGDFFESVPAGGDAYLLASIIHDWDDERSRRILENCRRAMAQSAKLLLVEMVIPPGNDPFPGKVLDLEMLVSLSGQERTEAEYRELLAAAGLRLTQIVATRALSSVIEAVPASYRGETA